MAPAKRNQIRLIAGQWRGRRLAFPPAPGLRPTPDRVRETLFNWLAPDLPGARCLDLFAGSGALGLEARSRGARDVVLVDRNPHVIDHLRGELTRIGMDGVSCQRAAALDWLAGNERPFDIVFVDPPFADALWETVLAALDRTGAVRPGGKVYVEMPRGRDPILPAGWSVWREGRAGELHYRLLQTTEAPDATSAAPGEISR
ncbi:MAG: 16S rRNA (guanine(966)-N(2))-methyltransferase RsmD [Pseudomonadota bacterium]